MSRPGAASADDVDEARRIFAEGVRLYQRGDFEGARRLFEQADRAHHAGPIVYNLALAEERLGHHQAAIDAYEAYLAEAGDGGEFSGSAAVAVAQIKGRSTRLRIRSEPPNMRVFVDGSPLREASPTTILVGAGHHVVVAEGPGFRAERELEVSGTGDVVTVTLTEPPRAGSLPPMVGPTAPVEPVAAREREPDGFVLGASFAIAPYYLLGVTTPGASNADSARSILAGPSIDAGLALDPRLELLVHVMGALGPDGKPSYAYFGGPGLAYHVARPLWLGATFLVGQLETRAHDARYGTDVVFGGMVDLSIVVLRKDYGEWLVSAQPSFLLTEQRKDNTALVLPLAFGFRSF